MLEKMGSDDQLTGFRQDIEDFLTTTENARIASERNRDYKDHKQWTSEERSKIESRGQAAITVNRIKPKVEGLKGLLIQKKTDPKAFARTQKHEKAAEMITDGLRFVADNNDFDKVKLNNAENVFVEGYGAILTDVQRRGQDIEIITTSIPWDRYYFDIHSRELDFSDKRWDGIVLWMDVEDVMGTFNLTEKEAEQLLTSDDGRETFDDRPQWVDRNEQRVRVVQHFFIRKKVWHMCFFTELKFLPILENGKKVTRPIVSPYQDEFGDPVNPIEAVAANIDRENQRFGEVTYWIDLQDEINHRRSKYLFLLTNRQTVGRKGSISDIPAMKRELSKADGHVEYQGEKGDFELLKTNDMAEAQFTLLQDAKGELDAIGFNAQLSGERQGDLSGKAIINLQQAATNELSSLYAGLTDLERRVYRQIWMRMKQFWTQEKWIRVTDDTTKLRWVGFNQPVTLGQALQERASDESIDLRERQQIQLQLQQMLANQDPRLNQIIEIKNPIAELDVDIILETSFDSVNIQREQFELLANIAQTRPDVPFTEVLKLSELRDKDKIIASIEQSAEAAQQGQKEVQDLEQDKTQSEIELNRSKSVKNIADSEAQDIESLLATAELLGMGVVDAETG